MENELQLIKMAKTGDIDAFAQLYQGIYKALYRCALYMLRNPMDAEDAVSETVIDAFASIANLRSEQAFKGWMFQILTNKCRKKIRDLKKKTISMEDICLQSQETQNYEESILIRQLFFELEETERLIISLHLFSGYKGHEIAQMLKLNENTVRSKESRALKKLAKKWRSI